MSRFNFMAGIALALIAIVVAAEELYSSEYDYVNASEIIRDEVKRNQYYKCFYGSAPCPTPDAQFVKDHLAEAILTQCKRCTEKQKENLNIMSTWYVENSPQEWNALIGKFIEDAKKSGKNE